MLSKDATRQPGYKDVPAAYQHLVCSKTRERIAEEYSICVRTLRLWLREKCPETPKRRLLSPQDVLAIYFALGWPPIV
jgi:hypothetical protein